MAGKTEVTVEGAEATVSADEITAVKKGPLTTAAESLGEQIAKAKAKEQGDKAQFLDQAGRALAAVIRELGWFDEASEA